MSKTNFSENLKEIAQQLRCPAGEKGLEIADAMNETNSGMTSETIRSLALQNQDSILELGHGNARHVSNLFKIEDNLTYTGLDISPLMNTEAIRINTNFINSGKASFELYNSLPLPFANEYFNKIYTVNTIYFWKKPELMLQEFYRVLKPNGLCSIAFIQKEFMTNLPFTSFNFEFYDIDRINSISADTDFKLLEPINNIEIIRNHEGAKIERPYTITRFQKA